MTMRIRISSKTPMKPISPIFETTSIDYEVHITEIEYDLDEEDDDLDLPKELTLWVESDRDKEDYDYDFEFEEDVRNAIEDEVGWMVKNFRYKVLSSK